MSDLDDVHRLAAIQQLVDDLPKEALDATFRVLENYAKRPPKGHAGTERMLAQVRERFLKKYEERARRTGTGFIAGTGGGGSFSPDGYGHSSIHGWEDHTSVTVQVHFFRGHELHTAERLSLSGDGKKLLFAVEATLPNGTPQRHEFAFDVKENRPMAKIGGFRGQR
jgi:hypothetical protein